jgi:magnesium chelatase family protein
VTLASNGVLYLDEIAEIPRSTLEVLRGPLEDGAATISRANGTCTFPARFALVASMTPPWSVTERSSSARCSIASISTCASRASRSMSSRRQRPVSRRRRSERGWSPLANADAPAVSQTRGCAALARHAALDEPSAALFESANARGGISARRYDRIRRVARTIADLAGDAAIARKHVAEALLYRRA